MPVVLASDAGDQGFEPGAVGDGAVQEPEGRRDAGVAGILPALRGRDALDTGLGSRCVAGIPFGSLRAGVRASRGPSFSVV